MQSKNVFTISGTLSTDVKTGETPTKTTTAWYVVAVKESFVKKDGSESVKTNFIPVTSYGKQAIEAIGLEKGDEIEVSGLIRSWSSEDKTKHGFNFVVNKLLKLERKDVNANAADDSAWLDSYNEEESQKNR